MVIIPVILVLSSLWLLSVVSGQDGLMSGLALLLPPGTHLEAQLGRVERLTDWYSIRAGKAGKILHNTVWLRSLREYVPRFLL